MEGYRIRRDRSVLSDGTLFGRRRRGIAPWKIISWLLGMGFMAVIIWQFDTLQPKVLGAFGVAPTATPGAATYAQRGYAAYLSGDLETAIDNYCRGSKGIPTTPFQEPRCTPPPDNSDASKTVNVDIGYELVRVLVYRSYDGRQTTTYTRDAEAWGRLIANASPKSSRARGIFAYALTSNGKSEVAVPEGLNAISLNPNDGEAYAALSLANYYSDRYSNAVTYGEKAVDLAPDSLDARIAFAKALFITGRNAQAEDQYKVALGINARLTFPYFELALFYLARANRPNAPTGLQEAAVAMYEEVLRIDNKNVKAYTRKCTAYFNQGDTTKALEACRNATSLDPTFTEAWKWQGQVYYNKRGYESAIESFQTCQKLERDAVTKGRITADAQYPECWYLQGLARYLLGRCDQETYGLFNEVLNFTRNDQAINLTRKGIAGCASQDPEYVPSTPIPTPTELPPPIK